MIRAVLAGVCACALASEGFGAAIQFTGDIYRQDFEGLGWATSGSGTDFGLATSGTEGWAAGSGSTALTTHPTYYFRQSSTEKLGGSRSGAPTIPGGGAVPPDLSFTRADGGTTSYISVYLVNATGTTINTADVGYTVEAWLNPTQDLSILPKLFKNVGTHSGSLVARPIFGTGVEVESFAFTAADPAGHEVDHALTLANLGWDSGETLALSWSIPSGAYGANHIYGLDDVFVSIPEPSVVLTASGVVMAALTLRRRASRVA